MTPQLTTLLSLLRYSIQGHSRPHPSGTAYSLRARKFGFLWVIGEPILFCAGVAIVWTAIRPAREHGLAMTAMVVTGYIP
jgi:hypothetical protein